MGRKRTKLTIGHAQRSELVHALRRVRAARDKERLQVLLRATSGRYTLEDLAEEAGRSRSTIQLWFNKFIRGGFAELLKRDTPPGSTSPIGASDVQAQLQAGLRSGRWTTAAEVAAWLKDQHGIVRSRKSLYYWLAGNGTWITRVKLRRRPKQNAQDK